MTISNDYLPFLLAIVIDKGNFCSNLSALNMSTVNILNDSLHITGILQIDEGETTRQTSLVSWNDDLIDRGKLRAQFFKLSARC